MSEAKPSFEANYERLETILNQLNEGGLELETSIKLYEEASQLIKKCSTMLDSAEKKVQTLMKDSGGEMKLKEDGSPQIEDYTSNSEALINRSMD